MTGRLITLPLRLYVRGTKLLLQATEEVAGRAASTALGMAQSLRTGGGQDGQTDAPFRAPEQRRPRDGGPEPDPRIARRAAAEPMPAAPEHERSEPLASEWLEREGVTGTVEPEAPDREPSHVSEQAAIVREEAEPGAEEGAGAAIHIDEPWQGYEHMHARDVVARVQGASSAELAAVQLYESAHGHRQSVLEAVERGLKSADRSR